MWTTRLSEIDRMFDAMDQLQWKMNRLFSDHGTRRLATAHWGGQQDWPRINLYDGGDHLRMLVEIPGLNREDVSIRLQGNYLEISGERKQAAPEGYTAHRLERGEVKFSRSFTLPADVDGDKVEAKMENGLLVISMPKQEAAKPKQITVR